jgi:bifunctional non-homologous end joining protein LigD
MLASLDEAPLIDERWAYEPKYDGIRALVEIEPARGLAGVKLWSRLGNEKTGQFPDVARALARFGRALKAPVLLDGEIVALDEGGEPSGFQRLQGRIHLTGLEGRRGDALVQPVAFVAFDALRDGSEDLRSLPLTARRARLERIFANAGSRLLRLSEFVPGDGRSLYRRALEKGWEGLIAKQLDSVYRAGRRSSEWRKLKIARTQTCVVGGWTEPRRSRSWFGALLLGVWGEAGALEYVGHTGTGFTQPELTRVAALLRKLETPTCPFRARPRTNERPHWVEPGLVAEVKFTEWTSDGKLRHPVYLGLRDDVPSETVRREAHARLHATAAHRVTSAADAAASAPTRPASRRPAARAEPGALASVTTRGLSPALAKLVTRLADLEAGSAAGTLTLPDGRRLEVSHLDKVLWPEAGITKGELMRYYVAVSPFIIPAVADRPLVMRRFPNGIAAKAFYQQRAPGDVPAGVRVEVIPHDRVVPSRLVGGSLATLLYMTQLAALSQDPWFSRVGSIDVADHAALDLDPMPGVAFARVVDAARWIHDELDRLGIPSVPKTSGAEGLHVYVPLPPRTPFDAGRLFCQIVATIVADKHPKEATVERSVDARGRRVYLDYLQNVRGKTLATAYSARASTRAGVSTPVTWTELEEGVDRNDFTLRTVLDRLRTVGDLWAALRASKGADLAAVLDAGLTAARR